jgi:hypothetical protein
VAALALQEWDALLAKGAFVKVMPHDYKRVLRELAASSPEGEQEALAASADGNGMPAARRPLDAVGGTGA